MDFECEMGREESGKSKSYLDKCVNIKLSYTGENLTTKMSAL